MIKIENVRTYGWDETIRGMRNPLNSWERSDSGWIAYGDASEEDLKHILESDYEKCDVKIIGKNDRELMKKLAKGGPVHAKYRRMISVYLDITAPLYWWKEFDTYKVGTVANSCSTMHKIHDKEFELSDFSTEHVETLPYQDPLCYDFDLEFDKHFEQIIVWLNYAREMYLKTKDKRYWWQMIQLLPSSYNQKRTIMLNYEVLNNIYHSRKNHKLDEWVDLCKWIEQLPFSEIITGEEKDENN